MDALCFKDWLQKNEGLMAPPVERPDENLRKDAEEGKECGAMPTGTLPVRKSKKRQKKS